ncbi:hypothetical protein Nepgr_024363 [Nepenthes gracilis]|uniref:Uncharacterized protein n=1 Tax=Nepenthes gracilis TaxID=150966 RepID=A0AAD3T2Y9_NEPGR|nr:hypothetical protein Nepgr_024363 [Nepenthes gracilis]
MVALQMGVVTGSYLLSARETSHAAATIRSKLNIKAMWAMTQLQFTPHFDRPLNQQPADRRFLHIVSAHSRRLHHPSSNSESSPGETGQDIGGLGHAVRNALQSSPQPVRSKTYRTRSPNRQQEEGKRKQSQPKQEDNGREISGADVLLALQRAGAQKSRSKRKKKGHQTGDEGGGGGGNKGGEDDADYSKVRPLCIKGDWGMRLEELEKRLQDFTDT